ncbi:MAG: hypothetical protein K2K20_04965 [Lachnospiraceae bacterium]|nr:hypothetical protein [Lachnospiraceae bacterium]
MANKDIVSENYSIALEEAGELGANNNQVMAEKDRAMEEASAIIAEIVSLTERVPSQIRSSALLEACTSAQAEIKKYEIP